MKVLMLAVLLTTPTFAQVTWDYTGAPMTETTNYASGAFANSTVSISGDVVLAEALAPNEADQIVTPTSFNLGNAFSNADDIALSSQFSFSTTNGAITAWDIVMQGESGNTMFGETISSSGDSYYQNWNVPSCQFVNQNSTECSHSSASNSTPGAWVDPPLAKAAPELSASGGQALTLLLGSIVLLNSRRQSRNSYR
jgi:hypothetical protein